MMNGIQNCMSEWAYHSGQAKTAKYTYFLVTTHHGLEVDNCEISAFNTVGIAASSGSFNVNVHHNYIHHIQRSGYGYGVTVSDCAVRIMANKFDYCRHHIASSGSPGCSYEAGWNLFMPYCTSTCLDMHGGRDRGDSTDIAGDWMHIHHNTFQGTQRAVGIRGTPSQAAQVHHNWFSQGAEEATSSVGNCRVHDNASGPEKMPQPAAFEFVAAEQVPCALAELDELQLKLLMQQ